jgi:hypothetical protein
MTQTTSNCFIFPMKERMASVTRVLCSRGRITYSTVWRVLAPSTWAASSTSLEMENMAAKRMTMLKPVECHVVTPIRLGRAKRGSPSQSDARAPRPMVRRTRLTIPQSKL